MIYKAELNIDENGVWHIISYRNRLIPYPILSELNNTVHETIDRVNGKLDWKRSYIKFTYNGKNYYQIDATGSTCEGCCFRDYNCIHPYFTTKGDCTGKIYKEEE